MPTAIPKAFIRPDADHKCGLQLWLMQRSVQANNVCCGTLAASIGWVNKLFERSL